MSNDPAVEEETGKEKEPWWKRALWVWSGLGVGAFLTICTFLYNLGKDVGDRGVKEQVEAAKAAGETNVAKCERAAAKVEEDLRQCSQSNASLQAVLRLSEADRNKILESAVVVPSIRLTLDGVPLAGRVPVAWNFLTNGIDGGVTGRCFEAKLWLENTSARDVHVDGIEALVDKEWSVNADWDSVPAETDPAKIRNFALFQVNLSPGARRYLPFGFCAAGRAEQLDVAMTVYASGYLPLRLKWAAIPR